MDAEPGHGAAVAIVGEFKVGGRSSRRLVLLLAVTGAVLSCATPSAAAPFTFAGPTSYTTQGSTVSVAAADFNGDGDPDLATLNQSMETVSIQLGGPYATFGMPTTYPTGGQTPYGLAVGDFNGDSDPDLAVANWGSHTVSILLGGTGGTFGSPTTYADVGAPFAIAVDDFNADHDPDLAVANGAGVSVLLGGTGGTFGTATSYPGGSGTRPVATGDFNGDDDPDIALGNTSSNNVSILIGGTGGTFGSATNLSVPDGPAGLVVSDFNGDDDPDIATANQSSASVLLGGTGSSFGAPTSYPLPEFGNALAVGDFNGDAHSDLVFGSYTAQSVEVLPGAADGTFGSATEFNAGGGPWSIAVADFNGDSDSDLAIANYSKTAVLVNARQRPAPPTFSGSDPPSPSNVNSPKLRGVAAAGTTVKLYATSDCSGEPAATGAAADFASPGLAVTVANDSSATFRAIAINSAGLASACSSSTLSYTEDSTAPPPPIPSGTSPASPSNANTPRVTGAAEAGSTVNLYTNADCAGTPAASGSATEFASPGIQVTVPDNSTTAFFAAATDQPGNVSDCSVTSVSYTEDSTLPASFALVAPVADAQNLAPSPSFSWGETSDASGIARYELWIDGNKDQDVAPGTCGEGACSATAKSALGDGSHTWEVHAVDTASNSRVSASRSFDVDGAPPSAFGLVAPTPGAKLADATPALSWQATTDDGSGLAGYQVYVDGDKLGPVLSASTHSYTPPAALGEGGHSWRVVALDQVGNQRSTPTRTFVVDTVRPEASFEVTPNPASTHHTVTFDAADSLDTGSGIAAYRWDLDGDGSFETDSGTSPVTSREYAVAREVEVTLRVVDAVGLSRDTTRVLDVRRSPRPGPLGISINNGAQFTNDPHVTLDAIWPPLAESMLISNDGGFADAQRLAVDDSVPWTLASSGSERLPKTVYVRFAGGESGRETYTDDIILDETAPVLKDAEVTPVATDARRALRAKGSASFVLTLRATDNVSGVAQMQVTQSREHPGSWRPFRKKTPLESGRQVWVRVRDKARNRSTWRRAS